MSPHALSQHWYRRGALAWLLWPPSLAFRALVALRRLAYRLRLLRSTHPGLPVVIVGNIVAGGAGKTPLVLRVVELLRERGWHPAIVSRGYGARGAAPRAALAQSSATEVGDEPLLLAMRSGVPVWVGADRVRVAAALRARHPEVDVLVLDDGLQHYRIARDIEIALVDGRGLGNGFMLPAGPLREPPARLREVDAVVLHGAAPAFAAGECFSMRLDGAIAYRLLEPLEQRAMGEFRAAPLHAVAGIGHPQRFFAHLAGLGLEVVPHAFPDHHPYGRADFDFGDDAPVLMTEKDAVKCAGIARRNFWVLPVRAVLEDGFADWLTRKLGAPRARSEAA